MSNEDDIRDLLEKYRANTLDEPTITEIKSNLNSNPEWKIINQQILQEESALRYNKLESIQEKLKGISITKNNSENQVDISIDATLTTTSDNKPNVEMSILPDLETTPDELNEMEIAAVRYRSLEGVLERVKGVKVEKEGKVVKMGWWKWLVAASVVGVVVMIGFTINSNIKRDRLYAAHFHPYVYKGENRGVVDNKTDIEKKAIGLYVYGEYKKAVIEFEKLDLINEREEIKIMYLYALVGSQKIEKAKNNLDLISDRNKIAELKLLLKNLNTSENEKF